MKQPETQTVSGHDLYPAFNVKEIPMKRTIAMLSLVLVLAVTAFAQTSQLKSACPDCCKDGSCTTCCPNGCGDCCK
jgi:hypothetical protein